MAGVFAPVRRCCRRPDLLLRGPDAGAAGAASESCELGGAERISRISLTTSANPSSRVFMRASTSRLRRSLDSLSPRSPWLLVLVPTPRPRPMPKPSPLSWPVASAICVANDDGTIPPKSGPASRSPISEAASTSMDEGPRKCCCCCCCCCLGWISAARFGADREGIGLGLVGVNTCGVLRGERTPLGPACSTVLDSLRVRGRGRDGGNISSAMEDGLGL